MVPSVGSEQARDELQALGTNVVDMMENIFADVVGEFPASEPAEASKMPDGDDTEFPLRLQPLLVVERAQAEAEKRPDGHVVRAQQMHREVSAHVRACTKNTCVRECTGNGADGGGRRSGRVERHGVRG